jgi:eukaryotic-like serine/threonine-protein kinase
MLPEPRRLHVLTHMEACVQCQRVVAAGLSSSADLPQEEGSGAELAPGATVARYGKPP